MSRRERQLVVGITAGWMHADRARTLYNGRSLLFLEHSMGEWFLKRSGVVPVLLPGARPERNLACRARDFAESIDGLLVQGGVDMAPESYGQERISDQWPGDAIRDAYELALIESCLELNKPVLGICRGHQVLNVALGGSLFQDIATQVEGALLHRCPERYHENAHEVVFAENSRLSELYGMSRAWINSVHHQAVDRLGSGLVIEARSPEDGIVEAIRFQGDRYAVGVQWHPEFQEPHQTELLPTAPLLEDFIEAMELRRSIGAL